MTMTLRRFLWRFTAWLIWQQSSMLRRDYHNRQWAAWEEDMTFVCRTDFIARRLFGDERGYRLDDGGSYRASVHALKRELDRRESVDIIVRSIVIVVILAVTFFVVAWELMS